MKTYYAIGLFISAVIGTLASFLIAGSLGEITFTDTFTKYPATKILPKTKTQGITQLVIKMPENSIYNEFTIVFDKVETIQLEQSEQRSDLQSIALDYQDDTLTINAPAVFETIGHYEQLTIRLPAQQWQITLPNKRDYWQRTSIIAKHSPPHLLIYGRNVVFAGQFNDITFWAAANGNSVEFSQDRLNNDSVALSKSSVNRLDFYAQSSELNFSAKSTAKQIILHSNKNTTFKTGNLELLGRTQWLPLSAGEKAKLKALAPPPDITEQTCKP